ncbi:MAG: delta-60 repeat domain-containing protein [Actinomycetia bacterium]|nr:delta-60 repeat domain-containing protein [Actinomycetes bacterium]
MKRSDAPALNSSTRSLLLVSALGAALVALSLAIGPTSARADGSAGEVNPRFDTGSGLSSPNPPTAALAIAIPGDGNKSVVSGYFTEYQGKRAPGLIRLKSKGKRDKSFKPGSGPNGPVESIIPLNDGKLLIGGNFTTYGGQAMGNIARLNADGSLDTSYQPAEFNDQVSAMALMRNGSLLVAGFFTSYGSQAVTGGLVKLNPDATLDTSFAAPADLQPGSVQSLLKLKNGKALVGGTFPSYGSSSGGGLVQVNSDGSVDSEFDVGSGFGSAVGGVYSMQKYRRGFLIGGSFSQYDEMRAVNLVHVGDNGWLSKLFSTGKGFDGQVNSVSIQPNNRVVVVGNFEKYRGKKAPGVAQLKKDGARDKSFKAGSGFNGSVSASALRPDGTVLVGGFFSKYNKQRAGGLVGLLTE